MKHTIFPPDGNARRTLFARKNQDRIEIIQRYALDQYSDYCNDHWPLESGKAHGSAEARVEAFLNCCADFILSGETDDVVTPYKEKMNGKREIPASSCPAHIKDLFYDDGPPVHHTASNEAEGFALMLERVDRIADLYERYKMKKKKKAFPPTRFQKIEAIKASMGCRCEFYHCPVDTECVFTHLGSSYKIHASVESYAPRQTKEGVLYDMDTIIVVVPAWGHAKYYDFSLCPIGA